MTSSIYQNYLKCISGLMDKVLRNESEKIEKAAQWMAEAVGKDQVIHVYGTGGHNFMGAAEFFTRAGSLLNYNIWMPGGTTCFQSHPATENLPGLARLAFDYYRPNAGELMIIINCNGINATTIDTALECRARGIRSVGITSREFAEAVEPECENRHPSKQNLYTLVDLYIDSYVPVGDMVLAIDRIKRRTGSSSTFTNSLIAELLNARTIEILADQGFMPDIFQSGNTKAGIVINAPLKEKWIHRIKHM